MNSRQSVMYKTCIVVIAALAGLGLLMWALVSPDVEGIPTRVRPYGESAFLVFPKYRSNTYSLARKSGDSLVPYPSRQAHEKGIITNAVDIHLDSRGTLWVLDSGVVRTLGKPLRKSGPRVLALDADTGEIKQTVPLDGLVRGRAQFLEVEEESSGPVRLYISDGPARCIAVWEVGSSRGRRLLLPRAVSHPSDVLYLALVGPTSLYFTYYRSPDMYVVDTREVAGGRGLVRRVGSKPPGVVIIGREGRQILFRVAGSPGVVYSWDTGSGALSRRTFLTRDSGCIGDPVHAVADVGKTWVLEADLAGFLSGRKVSHRIRTIRRLDDHHHHHRGIRPTDVAPGSSKITSNNTKGKPKADTEMPEQSTTSSSNCRPAPKQVSTGQNSSESATTIINKATTTTTVPSINSVDPNTVTTTNAAIASEGNCPATVEPTTPMTAEEASTTFSNEEATTTFEPPSSALPSSECDTKTNSNTGLSSPTITFNLKCPTTTALPSPMGLEGNSSSTSSECATTTQRSDSVPPNECDTSTDSKYELSTPSIALASNFTCTFTTPAPSVASGAVENITCLTTVSPTTESNIEATTTPQTMLTPAPTTLKRLSDQTLLPGPSMW